MALFLDTHISKIGELEELKKIRTNQDNEIDAGKKDVAILQLQQKLSKTKSKLVEVTELKNAEIDVLHKQLNQAENLGPCYRRGEARRRITMQPT